MSNLDTLLERNEDFAGSFDQGHLGIPPKLGFLIVTCVDARVDPAHYFGLALGDALVLRNAGARVTAGMINDIAILSFLVKKLQGPDAPGPQVLIIPHTKCGMQNFADPEAQAAFAAASGVDQAAIAEIAITTPGEAVRTDVERLRTSPLIDNSTVVGGFVYDVETGKVIEAAPLARLDA
jgi:carbonic anhydrase